MARTALDQFWTSEHLYTNPMVIMLVIASFICAEVFFLRKLNCEDLLFSGLYRKFTAILRKAVFYYWTRNELNKWSEEVWLTYVLMVVIFTSNVIGLLPLSFTGTSHLSVSMILSLIALGGTVVWSIRVNGTDFLNLFISRGVPVAVRPFLTWIEVISYAARFVSLGVRLFANMMAGHTLLKILLGFLWLGLKAKVTFLMLKIMLIALGWTIIAMVFLVETAIAGLQAYVFCTLISIYKEECIKKIHAH